MDDNRIIELYFERDEKAILETKQKYGTRLQHFALGILKNQEDAEECVNDTYLQVWKQIPPEKPEFFYAYLAKICRFTAFNKLDWKQAKKRSAELITLSIELENTIPDFSSEKRLESDEIKKSLNMFLARLPREQRIVFVRRYWFADSIKSISESYQMSESKVKTMLFRVRKKLKRYLESEGIL